VLVASNRGPVSYQFGADGSLTTSRGGGGMIAGVTDGLAALGPEASTTWICAALSDADRAVARARDAGPRDSEPIAVRMLDIAPDVFDRAYNRVANSTLWFLLHQLFDTPSQPRFDREFRRDWAAYLAYNEAFAEALMQEALTRPAAGIGHFCHTPWAPPDYYRMLPDEVGRALLDGILGADRAGFHAERWASAFMDCCAAVLGADVTRTGLAGPGPGPVGRVTYRGHVTEVAVHPLGVDAAALRERARAGDVRAHAGALRRAAGDRKLIVRVDRTELSKNIVRGLAAYRELLTTRPQWRGRIVHLAFAYPSRSALAEYRAYTGQVRELARQITEEFRTADWDPLILEVKDDYPRSLAACALADVLLVNPIRDGMNLVAQEGPVLSERGCALVLSREAGAAATLAADALLVNPYDVTETADALHRALEMPDAERQRRGAALAATAASDPPARWLGGQLASLRLGS
jgi:trehalose 6-phosphate synthase